MSKTVVYRINKRNEIVYVNEAWDTFALANGGDGITSDKVLHKNLFHFITNPTVQQIYLDLISLVRSGRTVTFNYRCDSPNCKRYLTMSMFADHNEDVTFESRITWEQDQPYQSILDSSLPRSNMFILMCSWCKRVEVNDTWCDLDEAVNRLGLLLHNSLPSISHTICKECYHKLLDLRTLSLR